MAANRNGFLTIVLCGLLLGSAVMETCEGSSFPWPLKTRHVQVANEFRDELLNVHCRSKDNDLGSHLKFPGMTFEWKFKVNFFLTTLYYCDLSWNQGHRSVEVYDASSTLYDVCGPGNTCQWLANERGIYMYNAKRKSWDFKFPWTPLSQ